MNGEIVPQRQPFGTLADGSVVEAITLAHPAGIRATILTYGATLQALHLPDREDGQVDVVLGHDSLTFYLQQPQYLGATVGRVANRIAGGRFTLDGKSYCIAPNNGPNALHGGANGFDKANWRVLELATRPAPLLKLGHVSPDGDQGFPGTLRVTASFTLPSPDTLALTYEAATDRPTLVNISNHAYWNLAGEGSADGAMGHRLQLFADHYLPTDETAIPTGEVRPVDGSPFDFREPRLIGERVRDATDAQIRIGRGYDHNMVLRGGATAEPRLVARLTYPGSGQTLELLTDQPGLQYYSGNFLDGTSVGKSGRLYRMGDGVALEPQMFPDTPNQPAFGSIRLAAGDRYRNRMLFRFPLPEIRP